MLGWLGPCRGSAASGYSGSGCLGFEDLGCSVLAFFDWDYSDSERCSGCAQAWLGRFPGPARDSWGLERAAWGLQCLPVRRLRRQGPRLLLHRRRLLHQPDQMQPAIQR